MSQKTLQQVFNLKGINHASRKEFLIGRTVKYIGPVKVDWPSNKLLLTDSNFTVNGEGFLKVSGAYSMYFDTLLLVETETVDSINEEIKDHENHIARHQTAMQALHAKLHLMQELGVSELTPSISKAYNVVKIMEGDGTLAGKAIAIAALMDQD